MMDARDKKTAWGKERPPYVLTAHDREGVLRETCVDCDRIVIEGHAAGLYVQHTEWDIRINGRLLYGDGPKEWCVQPVC